MSKKLQVLACCIIVLIPNMSSFEISPTRIFDLTCSRGNELKEAASVVRSSRLLCGPQQHMRAGQATAPRFQCGVILI